MEITLVPVTTECEKSSDFVLDPDCADWLNMPAEEKESGATLAQHVARKAAMSKLQQTQVGQSPNPPRDSP